MTEGSGIFNNTNVIVYVTNQMNQIKYLLMLSAILLCSFEPVFAHHGFRQYFDPDDPVRIEGTIHEVYLGNPHSVISVAADGDIWSCEAQPMVVMARKGVDESTFIVGEKIVIEGFRSHADEYKCQVKIAYLANGDSYRVRLENGRPWVVDEDSMAAKAAQIGNENSGIFGRWIRVIAGGGQIAPEFFEQITEAGQAANQTYDPYVDDPSLHCNAGPLFRAMGTPGQQTEIQRDGNQILISHEYMDANRIIYLNGSEPDIVDIQHSQLGFSVGEFVDGELHIKTIKLTPGVLLNHYGESGVTYSDSLEFSESISVDAETGNLLYRWDAIDEKYFGAPASGSTALEPSPYAMSSYNCGS